MNYSEIKLTQGNISQGHFYLPEASSVFPIDSWGGKNRAEKGKNIVIAFDGIDEEVATDIDGTKRLFRDARGQSKRFINHYNLSANEIIYVWQSAPRRYTVSVKLPIDDEFESLQLDFENQVRGALAIAADERKSQIENAPKKPEKFTVTATVYRRNPNVVAESLVRARGKCERCGNDAPFDRRADGTPYLEVHHKVPLSKDGDDTIENTIALCPNCHRYAHFG